MRKDDIDDRIIGRIGNRRRDGNRSEFESVGELLCVGHDPLARRDGRR
jgi:hypothetical protein